MARDKKATGDAPKKRTSRVATTEQSRENGNVQTLQASTPTNGGSTPLRMTGGEEAVRRRAYEIWEQRGRQHGRDADDWFRAESEVRGKSA